MITFTMDQAQSNDGQNIYQVTQEVGQDPSASPLTQGEQITPDFVPPENVEGELPPEPSGGGILRLVIIIILIIVLAVGAFFVFRYLKSSNKGPVTLNYWGLWEDEAVMQGVVADFEKNNPKIKIQYVLQTPKQYRERLEAAISRGGEVDIFRFHNAWVPMFKNNLAEIPENILSKKDFEMTFYPVAAQDLKVNDNYVAIPLMIDGLALYYNEDILKAAAASVPKTWDELQETALALTVKDTSGTIKTAGVALGTASNVEHFSDILALMFMQNGVNLYNILGPEASEALAYYRIFAEQPNNTWDENQDNSISAFAKGKVAMIFAPSWQAFTISALNPQLKFKTAPVPQLPGTNISWASYWAEGVAKNSLNQKEAWTFLKYLSDKETMVKLYSSQSKLRKFGEPYSRSDLAQTLTDQDVVGAFILQAPQARSFPLASRTFDNGLNDRLIKYLEDAVNSITQGSSPESALTTAASGFNQVLSQYGVSAAVSK